MVQIIGEFDPAKPDASFDLEGVVFKMTVLEAFINQLGEHGVFDEVPEGITGLRRIWKGRNNEANFKAHLGAMVGFFLDQIPNKDVDQLKREAILCQQEHGDRQWNVTIDILNHLKQTHNIVAASLLPEWLMLSFVPTNLGFVAMMGSSYEEVDGVFSGKAQTIDKAEAYLEFRSGDASMLDTHMGDTTGDSSIFRLAKRPIYFNPSATLFFETPAEERPTTLASEKDLTSVFNPGEVPEHYAPEFDPAELLSHVRSFER